MNSHTIFMTMGKIVIYSLLFVLTILAGTYIFIATNSPGQPIAYKDSSGKLLVDSISEKGTINLAGIKLGFFIKGENKNKPILLYLHGGMPDYFLTGKYPTGLDKIFTVVWLDQRGAGLSFDASSDKRNINLELMVNDIRLLTNYLREQFAQDKIFLMAHSGGTYLGVKVIEKYPELYKAYIGVAQISYQKLSEKMAYEYIMEQYKNNPKKAKIYNELLINPVELSKPIPETYIKYRDYAMHDLGVGTMKNMKDVITGIFIPSLLFKEYSFSDKINLWRGKANSGISVIWNELINNDLSEESTTFDIPVYFFHGIHDYTCSYELAKNYYEKINAPDKKFFTFMNSAHSPIFEEPLECLNIIESEILK